MAPTVRIHHYQLLAEIGAGGMARVFRAYDERLKRHVALKLIRTEFANQGEFRALFEREARVVASLDHLAVVPIYDFGEIQGQLYLVMRLITGGTLGDKIGARQRAGQTFTVKEVLSLFERLAPTLDEIHRQGIIHRDLKPTNILFDQQQTAFIADFGVARVRQAAAKLSQTGAIMGTLAYCSPEQIRGQRDLDGRSDVYALGVLLFEMLGGRLPFHAEDTLGWMYQHLQVPVPDIRTIRRDLPPRVNTVLQRALAKDRNQRYPTVATLVTELRAAVSAMLLTPRPTPAPPFKVVSPRSNSIVLVAVVSMVVLVSVILLGLLNTRNNDIPDPSPLPTSTERIVATLPPNPISTTEGQLSVFDLFVGDCFLNASNADDILGVTGVPCSQGHDGEVFALVNYPADRTAPWPEQTEIDRFSDEACIAEFERYVGIAYADSKYFISYLQPTEESWASAGDREIVCLAVGDENSQITGSVEGVAE